MKYNPFNPNSVVATNLFAGRSAYVLQIIKKLEQIKRGMPSSFLLFGERGIGKTALAKLIKHIAESNDPELGHLNFLTSYYNVEKGQEIGSVLQSSVNELTDVLPEPTLKTLGHRLGNLFKNGKFSIGAFSLDLTGMAQNQNFIILKDQLISILSQMATSIKENLKEVNARNGMLIIIDEIQNVANLEACAQLFRGIITTLDVKELGYVSFLLIGSGEDIFFSGDPSARRQFDSIQLGVMPIREAMEVMTKAFREVEVTWDENELQKNIIATGGYPHSIQILGHHLLGEDTDNFIGADDWKKALAQTAWELQKKDFAELYNFDSKPTAKEMILDILAVAGRPMSKTEIQSCSEIKNIYQYIPELMKRGSIRVVDDTDKLVLHSELFRTSVLLKILPKVSEGYLKNLIHREDANLSLYPPFL